ncbi:MAG: hypothetical protein WDO56_28645 [Gammaproteobacteria bacterium]
MPAAGGAPGTGMAAEHSHKVFVRSSASTPSTDSMPFSGVERIQGFAEVSVRKAR